MLSCLPSSWNRLIANAAFIDFLFFSFRCSKSQWSASRSCTEVIQIPSNLVTAGLGNIFCSIPQSCRCQSWLVFSRCVCIYCYSKSLLSGVLKFMPCIDNGSKINIAPVFAINCVKCALSWIHIYIIYNIMNILLLKLFHIFKKSLLTIYVSTCLCRNYIIYDDFSRPINVF